MTSSVLVIGAGGFIASHLITRLRSKGYQVSAVSKRPIEMEGVTCTTADHAQSSGYANLLRTVDNVVWLAGASTPSSSAGKPLSELKDNLLPLLTLMEASPGLDPKRMVFISTGGAIYGDVQGIDASETTPTEPKSYYSAGKVAAEAFLSAWAHEGGHNVTILRPSNVYGPGQPYRPGFGIVPTAFHSVLTGDPVVIRGDGSAVRDYLYISDLVDLIVKVLEQPAHGGTTVFNASSSLAVPLNTLLDVVGEVTGKYVPRDYQPAKPYDVGRVVLDNAKARGAFDWHPATALADGLERSWRATD